MSEQRPWQSRQLLYGLLGGWGVALAMAVWTRPRPVIDIDVDNGLVDCPWPREDKGPNGAGTGMTETGSSVSTDVFAVLRAGDRVLLAEPVDEVLCTRPHLGPEITLMLRADARPLGTELPPPLDRNFIRSDTFEDGVTAYRLALRILHAFRVSNPENLVRLDTWYRNSHDDVVEFDLGHWPRMAWIELEFGIGLHSKLLAQIHVDVSPEHDPVRHACDPLPDADGGRLPACTPPWFIPRPATSSR